MDDDQHGTEPDENVQPPIEKPLTPAARRALAEAAERRRRIDAEEAARAKEIDGRGGKDPARYGDWEIKGRAIDF
ncbi:DUF1674 domain-containing protein [Pararhizobium mangrovi]|uniref:DUF1674 domain-containing protein n=1 Tax=Pararhizobium mangrovi TaxID=2590452 RepID=A0A506TYV8_9HYPH|nr:DUF1674 domain-containing protein [Pararhizobium mangrovi]TPW27283.1 DUF1674 domain-containing protein [Pararhizobium mangrovi]